MLEVAEPGPAMVSETAAVRNRDRVVTTRTRNPHEGNGARVVNRWAKHGLELRVQVGIDDRADRTPIADQDRVTRQPLELSQGMRQLLVVDGNDRVGNKES